MWNCITIVSFSDPNTDLYTRVRDMHAQWFAQVLIPGNKMSTGEIFYWSIIATASLIANHMVQNRSVTPYGEKCILFHAFTSCTRQGCLWLLIW